MKCLMVTTFVGFFLATILVSSENASSTLVTNIDVTKNASMNEYLDLIMPGVGAWLINNGLIPMELPDTTVGFEYKPLLIPYGGKVELIQGVLLKLGSVIRSGDCFMSYDRQLLRVKLSAALDTMTFIYYYKTTVMGLGIFDGWIDGYIENIVLTFDILIDMTDFYIFLQDFNISSVGYINVSLKGNMLTDWLGNIMLDIITFFFKNTVTEVISTRVRDLIQETIDVVNENSFASNEQITDTIKTMQESKKIAAELQMSNQFLRKLSFSFNRLY